MLDKKLIHILQVVETFFFKGLSFLESIEVEQYLILGSEDLCCHRAK
jgi:hypothetical protein